METNQINPHWIEISASALHRNLAVIKKQLQPKIKIMAMVKANAYGHGLPAISTELSSYVDFFGINTIQEALTIRSLGIKNPILITSPIPTTALSQAQKLHLSLCVHSLEYLNTLNRSHLPLHLHLKINTGMNRLGLTLIELLTAIDTIRNSGLIPEGIYSHFHSADTDSASVENQLDLFNQAVYQTKYNFPNVLAHCANSAAIFSSKTTHFDMVRPGHAVYGLHPHSKLTPILSWKARIVQTRRLLPGSVVGYGGSYTSTSASEMSVLPVGYSDGLDRKLGNHGHVYCNRHIFPIIGRISMNFTSIASHDYQLSTSDVVELIGPHIPAKQLADLTNTIDYEIVTRLNPEIPRIIVK